MVLSWGKPTVEYGTSTAGVVATTFKEFPAIKEDTAKLTPTAGTALEATEEGGALIDTRPAKNKYKFEVQLFVKKGDTKPIEDEDGVIAGNYSVRLTPEDNTQEGFVMPNCSVVCEESWSSKEGKYWKYTFTALKPATGNMLQAYTKTNAS